MKIILSFHTWQLKKHRVTVRLEESFAASPGCINLVLFWDVICYLVTLQLPLTSFIFSLSNFPLSLGMIITSLERWLKKKERNQDTVCKNNKLTLHSPRQWIIFATFLFLPLDFHHKHSPLSIFSLLFFLLLPYHQNRFHSSVFYCLIICSGFIHSGFSLKHSLSMSCTQLHTYIVLNRLFNIE